MVTSALLSLHRAAPAVAEGSAARAALIAASRVIAAAEPASSPGAVLRDPAVCELHDLSAETKESVLQWAQAQSILLAIFGPREPLTKLTRTPGNAQHFERLFALAKMVDELGRYCELDESYFVPLRDLDELQRQLHVDSALSKAAHEGLLVFAMNAKRRGRSTRRRQ